MAALPMFCVPTASTRPPPSRQPSCTITTSRKKAYFTKRPSQMLKQWRAQQPHLFKKSPCNHPGPDINEAFEGCLEGGG